MGEYEDRYPDAYGRSEEAAQPPGREEIKEADAPRQVRDRPLVGGRPGVGAAAETAPSWQHAPSEPMVEPTPPLLRGDGTYRGLGPRGYARAPQRIYEDVCDRLTDNPFIDASDIEVFVSGSQVTLAGSVDSVIALRQAAAISREVAGVSEVRNDLLVRAKGLAGSR